MRGFCVASAWSLFLRLSSVTLLLDPVVLGHYIRERAPDSTLSSSTPPDGCEGACQKSSVADNDQDLGTNHVRALWHFKTT